MNIDCTEQIDKYLKKLFPIARSITGDGNRESLKILQEIIPLEVKEYPSGQKVYDWNVPKEWRLKEAWIKNSGGEKIVDLKNSNLHIVGYSIPFHGKLKLNELKAHLHYLEELPEAIPYRTSYYKENWGFCISFEEYEKYFNEEDIYEVFIDSEFTDGSLSIGEYLIPGKIQDEILLSTYICHPSLANDNLSGMLMTAFLSKELKKRKLKHSFRVVFVPETIGAIAYCANNEAAMKKIDSGFVITCVGGPGNYGFKQSFEVSHPINSLVEQTLRNNSILNYEKYPFDPHGSDERQYSSQGFRINVVNINKDRYYNYKGYHTSLDNLDFISAGNINNSLNIYMQVIGELDSLERHKNPMPELKNIRENYSEKGKLIFKNQYPHCEIMLSKYGLYPETGGAQKPLISNSTELDMVLWTLFYSDGILPLGHIAEKTRISEDKLYNTAMILNDKKLLEQVCPDNNIKLEKRMIHKNDFDGNLVYGGKNFHKTTNREKIIVHKKFPHYEFMDFKDGRYVAREKYFQNLHECPLCASQNLKNLLSKDGLLINQCEDCTFGFQNPRFRKEFLFELYYGEYSLDATYVSEPQKKLDEIKFKYAMQNIKKHIDAKSVLDIGAGNLHFLKICMEEGCTKLYGIEPGNSAEDETGKIHVIREFSEAIPPYIKDLSLITMWDTLEHVHDIKKSIRNSYNALGNGGVLLVMVPNFMSLASRLIREKSPTFCVYHLNYFTEQSLEKLLESHGFKVLLKETIISEIDNCRNYLEFQEPYMSKNKNESAFSWLTPEYIHENMLGSRLFFLVQKQV